VSKRPAMESEPSRLTEAGDMGSVPLSPRPLEASMSSQSPGQRIPGLWDSAPGAMYKGRASMCQQEQLEIGGVL
jgi:hypothetical protein